MTVIFKQFHLFSASQGGGATPATPKPQVAPNAPTQALSNMASPAYLPKLSELVALLHSETQQVIEYLAQPNLRLVTLQAPSASFVKIERMNIEMPIRLLVQVAKVSPAELAKVSTLSKSFTIQNGTSLDARVMVLGPQITATTQSEGMLRIEFSVAGK